MRKRAFITGATGFVGGALAEQLSASGWELVALVRGRSDWARLKELGAILVIGELSTSDTFAESLKGCSVVFHCAGLTGVSHTINAFHQVISVGTHNLLDVSIAAGVERFVFVSSIVVYELNSAVQIYNESQPVLSSSVDPYGRAKVEAETACMNANHRGDISVRIVRPVFIYGPGDRRGGFLPEIASMIKNRKLRLMDGGDNPIPLIYISDLVDLLILCAESDQGHGQIYNASSEDSPAWRQLVDHICEEFQLKPPKSVNSKIIYLLASLLETAANIKLIRTLPMSKAVVKLLSLKLQFPSAKACQQLGYQPKVSFQQGINNSMPMLEELLNEQA